MNSNNALTRGRAMLAWVDSLAPDEFEEAVANFHRIDITDHMSYINISRFNRLRAYEMLLTAWAEVDPIAALAYTTQNTPGGALSGLANLSLHSPPKTGVGMATATVLAAWAGRDPDSAIAWAKANHGGDEANPNMVGVIQGIAASNLTRATELLEGLPDSDVRREALQNVTIQLFNVDRTSAEQWISSLSDESLRDQAATYLAREIWMSRE